MNLNYDDFLSQLKNDDILNNQGNLFEIKTVINAINTAFDETVPSSFHNHCSKNKANFKVNSVSEWFDWSFDYLRK